MALLVALPLSQVHAAVGPVVNDVGADDTVCKYRAIAPTTNGEAIDVPVKLA